MQFLLHVTCSCIPHAYILYFQYTCYIWNVLGLFWLSLSLPLFYVYVSHVYGTKMQIHSIPEPFFVLWHHLPLILLLLISGSVMRMSERTSQRTFLDKVFIQNVESFWRTSTTLTFLMSFTIWIGSHCVTSRSHVHPCWSRSFTPTCMDLFRTSLSYLCSRYAHCCHTAACCGCAPYFEGKSSWLPQMLASKDCVQRQDDLCFLQAPFWLGWLLVYTM